MNSRLRVCLECDELYFACACPLDWDVSAEDRTAQRELDKVRLAGYGGTT